MMKNQAPVLPRPPPPRDVSERQLTTSKLIGERSD